MMLQTTGYNFDGYRIVKYLKVVSSEVVLGTGLFSSIGSSVADFTGKRSGAYERKLEEGKESAIYNLEKETTSLGGNAIIGIDIDYTNFVGDVIGVVATGTAVIIEKETVSKDADTYTIPVLSYNEKLPFNICNVIFESQNDDIRAALDITAYNNAKVKALVVDIELEDIFGEATLLEKMVLAVKEIPTAIEYQTSFVKLGLKNLRIDLLQKAYVSVKKVVFYGNKQIVDVDTSNEKRSTIVSEMLLSNLRTNYGKDAVMENQTDDNDIVICYCGAKNHKNVSRCYRCKRTLNRIVPGGKEKTIALEKTEVEKILDEATSLSTAKDIYEFLKNTNKPELESLVYELKIISKQEAVFGDNNKDEAIETINKMISKL